MTDPPPLVEFLTHQPVALRRMLAWHIADDRGRCRVCVDGARGVGLHWPCNIRTAAEAAAAARRQRGEPL
ncbi:MAG: hypothetical protein ACRDRK_14095 [Pseudonocardia sp.]